MASIPSQPVASFLRRTASVAAFAFLAGGAAAQIEADIRTNRGTITVNLAFDLAPRATANFIKLAEGTQRWIDPDTGAVRDEPFYDGLAVDEITNSTSLESLSFGTNAGYTFPDEFNPSLSHESYSLSMSGDGPNSNSGSVCITGNTALPERDGLDTVFGKVTQTASRTVIDSIIAAGSGQTTITTITIRKTGTAATAFAPDIIPLPVASPLAPALKVTPGISVSIDGFQPALSVVAAHASTGLISWIPHFRKFAASGDPSSGPSLLIDNAELSSRFYNFSIVRYPENPVAAGPSHLAGRRLSISGEGFGTLVYQFDDTGLAGTYQNILLPGEPPFFSGNFQVSDLMPAVFGPYGFRVLIHAEGLGGAPYNLIRGGIDHIEGSTVGGRHETTLLGNSLSTVFDDKGSLVITRP